MTTAFESVPRDAFLPPVDRGRASYDGPIGIGHGQTNSQPRTVEDMLRLLEVHRGMSVLDVGAGSGWTTALLGHLTGPAGHVRGVELVPAIAEWGAANLASVDQPWCTLSAAQPDVLGAPEHAPYDRILVSAEASSLPDALVDQLGDPGRMVIPVNSVMLLVTRTDGEVEVSRHGYYSFVPLR